MSIAKRIVLSVVILVVVLLGVGYAYLSYLGVIPRYDYDELAPQLPEFSKPAVLVLNKTNGFIHHDALPAADAMLTRITNQRGWDIFISDNGASHNEEDLAKFNLIVWNNVSGDVLNQEQRSAFKTWIENGGGWVGLHASGGDREYLWNWHPNTLIGAQFVGHTMEPQFQDAELLVVEQDHSLTDHLPSPWRIAKEEWYAFDRNPRASGSEILLTIDKQSYITKGNTRFGMVDSMSGEHPLVWRHRIGDGRVFYSAIGHTAQTYDLAEYEELISRAMDWAMKK